MKNSIRWFPALALLTAAGAQAQELLTTDDGISLRGTVRLLQGNAATCNVLEANEPNYEEVRINQDQPLHLWELEFSVFDGSGRALNHLIAYYDIASPWPPCTNWTEHYRLEGDHGLLQVQWVDPSGRIQHTGAATPTLPNQAHTETILLLAFNGVRPQFADWSVNYTFLDAGTITTTPAEAEAQPQSASTLPDGVTADSICTDKLEGQACWMELDNIAGCYIWNPNLQQSETVTWSGQCSGGLVNGTGTQTWIFAANGENTLTYGPGPYLNGKMHGTWTVHNDDGDVFEIPFVNGERHGTEVERQADGYVIETPYLNGEIHGTQVFRSPGGIVTEYPWVNGEEHGTQVRRLANGDIIETPWVNGQMHGTQVWRNADGSVHDGCFANNEYVSDGPC